MIEGESFAAFVQYFTDKQLKGYMPRTAALRLYMHLTRWLGNVRRLGGDC